MRGTLSLSANAWQRPGNGALFSRIQPPHFLPEPAISLTPLRANQIRCPVSPPFALLPRSSQARLAQFRPFSVSRAVLEARNGNKAPAKVRKSYREEMKEKGTVDVEEHEG